MPSSIAWQKSSYSGGGDNNNCVELGRLRAAAHPREGVAPAVWQKSSYSSGCEDENCVEVGRSSATIHLRESDTSATVLTLTPHRLAGLIRTVKAGVHDRGQ
ncbi:DUF397 domain-containing protein [Streptomyces sp. HU2014]|uniref:DUF397 domain-containing protein n=1 Tax=Streptomyces sp. HU2014 TaxID=2939414 RepID=UPI00200E5D63|nr:DUF397 domain-containing protein [Streptomyces sp. HU2014]UQI48258.1 DUF397 domain-containing protein [Streptomyces sp. HU2014]